MADAASIHSSLTVGSETSQDDDNLRTFFQDVTQGCTAFRILLIGRAGTGKSTLVSEVFDFEDYQGNTSHFQSGEHNINEEIVSSNNKGLILHDSKGLETGSDLNLKIVTRFVEERKGKPFPEQLHAIWYCVEIPIGGERLLEGGDIRLLKSLKEFNDSIPIVIVFTKLDRLQFSEKRRLKKEAISKGMSRTDAEQEAERDHKASADAKYQESCVKVIESASILREHVEYCAVSNKLPDTVINLIRLTKRMLIESEALSILWARAQMADVDSKVDRSIAAGKNVFWRGLFSSIIPMKGIRKVSVLKVLSVVHRDIIGVWNIQDPDELLSGANMRTMIRALFAEPGAPTVFGDRSGDVDGGKVIANIAGAAMSMNPVQLVGPTVTGTAKVLDDVIDTTPGTARMLMAYIIDLTLGLENLYWIVHPRENKAVSDGDVLNAFTAYRASQQRQRAHRKITNFVGDENIARAWKKKTLLAKLSEIAHECRFNATDVFKSP